MQHDPSASPIRRTDRIESLDVLRGFALLGILIMNIQSFSMPGAVYINPTAYGDLTGVNLIVWTLSHLFADQKFMTIFSMLFGAGVCVFADRATAKSGKSAGLHYRRTAWLLVFGLLHAHLLWYGDVLYAYAMCGFVVYLFRNRTPRALVILGVVFALVPFVYSMLFGLSIPSFPAEAVASIRESWASTPEALARELEVYRGGWTGQLADRSGTAVFFETYLLLTLFFWRASGMMLLGMALYKTGVLSAACSDSFYRRMLLVGFAVGLTLSGIGVWHNFAHDWSMEFSMFLGSQWNYFGSVATALGYIGIVMLAVRAGLWEGLQNRLKAVGKTAFTNYILQTVLGTLIFYGHGLGLFGSVDRWQQVLVILAIWLLQLWLAPVWLGRYRYGPLEWLWRCLTYWRLQPLRRSPA